MVGCEVLQGVASKSQLNASLRCKACHAEERVAFRIRSLRKSNCTLQNALVEKAAKNLHGGLRGDHSSKLGLGAKPATPRNSASAAPQNQLQLAERTCRKKFAVVCCGVPRRLGA